MLPVPQQAPVPVPQPAPARVPPPVMIKTKMQEKRDRLMNDYYDMFKRWNNYQERMLRGEVEAPNPYAKPLDPRKNDNYKDLFE